MTLDQPRHLAEALRRRGYLFSWWPWRALTYLATTVPIAGVLSVGLLVFVSPLLAVINSVRQDRPVELPIVVFLTVVGMFVLALAPIMSVTVTVVERWRLGIVDPRPLPGHRLRGLAARYTSTAAWREVGYAFWLGGIVPIAYWMLALLALLDFTLIASPWLAGDADRIVVVWATVDTPRQAIPYAILGTLFIPVLWYLLGLLAAVQATVVRLLLGGPTGGAALREVTRSRTRLVDAYEAERRRIERDVHDGAQPRLTSLTLQLGLAKLDVPDDSLAAKPLAIAHEQAKGLMVTLRQIVHGIRPQSLTELGLAGAVRELAGEATIPVTVRVNLGHRLTELVEATAFFVVSESLGNVARHAQATRAEVRLTQADHDLIVEVEDDGCGGADPAQGTGLTGLADRVAAVNGRLLLASPTGGPTLVRVELPCRP
jgi:signal transduction histidine kinase